MSARKIVGWLSEEDRERYARSYAMVMVAVSGNPNVDPNDACDAIIADQNLIREMRTKYEIDDDEAVDFGLYDGAILDSDEE